MAIGAGSPLFEGDRLIGVLYGGQLLNGSNAFVDTVRTRSFKMRCTRGRA